MKNRIKNVLEKCLSEDETVLLADGFEDAFIGIGRQFGNPISIYNKKKCIKILMKNMSLEEAEEYFQYNVEGAWVGKQTPIFLD